ncbi:MAG: hypothetical protein DRP78_01985 [Candidatus Omnitrophota bacterium]|nr:MAG: hypothetical protein DRP78_01985 [Candidatus Omnitrophota bacterium]
MKFKDKLKLLNYVLKARLLKVPHPLAIRWNITYRCSLNCIYCNFGNTQYSDTLEAAELKTKDIFLILRQLSDFGLITVSFSGGEPMLRDDIGDIITYCKGRGIKPEMNSSGKFIASRVKELKDIALLKLSLDGPEGIHELTRKGVTFKELIKAADACAKHNIRFSFSTTITKYNVNYLNDILDIAHFYKTIVAFQPLTVFYENSQCIKECFPSQKEFKAAVEMLMQEKRRGNKHIRNSSPGLSYILNWPKYKRLRCWAGKVFCVIEPDGTLSPCDRINHNMQLPNCLSGGFKKAYESLVTLKECSGCGFCGTIELNFLMAFNFSGTNPIRKYV